LHHADFIPLMCRRRFRLSQWAFGPRIVIKAAGKVVPRVRLCRRRFRLR
jgi:hypothetical protein